MVSWHPKFYGMAGWPNIYGGEGLKIYGQKKIIWRPHYLSQGTYVSRPTGWTRNLGLRLSHKCRFAKS